MDHSEHPPEHADDASFPVASGDQAPDTALVGPKQSRKPNGTSSSLTSPRPTPTYDPAALLNPKAKGGKATDDDGNTQAVGEPTEGGSSALIEQLHGVVNREDVPSKKRKSENVNAQESDEERKKAKTAFSTTGSNGVISDQLKEDRRNNASQVEAIDLTMDDDDDIQVIKDTGNEEVCLGVLRASANVHRIPNLPASAFRSLGKDYWPRTKVTFRRDTPTNQVIDLADSTGAKFGTMEAKVASALCLIMQGSSVNRSRFKIYLLSRARKPDELPGVRVSLSWPTDITFFAPRRLADAFGRMLSQRGLFLVAPIHNPGKELVNTQVPRLFGPASSSLARPQTVSHVSRTAEELRRESNNMFDNLAKSADAIPERELNSTTITTPLMIHQKQALHFMMEHEQAGYIKSSDLKGELSLWKTQTKPNGQQSWYHVITGQEVAEKPKPSQGGILADVMGLGKTLSILALIAETMQMAAAFRRTQVPAELDDDVEFNAKGTLIVCPKSVMANWQEQIVSHTAAAGIKLYAYHGPNRLSDAKELSRYDVVITTYNTVASEFSDRARKGRPLASLNWFRIVLDEAHAIRTQSTGIFKACRALNAERRWAVTGTPVQNGLEDLGALVKFLRIKPFDDPAVWQQHIIAPLKMGQEDAIQHLQILVGSISLRRLKDTVDLFARHEEKTYLTFSKAEYALYSQFAKKCGTQLRTMTGPDNKLGGKAYAHVLKSIGQLRGISAHGREMLSEEDMKGVEGYDDSSANAIVIDVGDEPDRETGDDFLTEKAAFETFQNMEDSERAGCEICDKRMGKDKSTALDDFVDLTSDSEEDDDLNQQETTQEDDVFGYLTSGCFHLICSDCLEGHKARTREELGPDHWLSCPCCEQYVRNGLVSLTRSGLQHFRDAREAAARRPKTAKWDEHTYTGQHTKVKALIQDLKESQVETANLADGEPPIRSVVFSGWTSYLDLIEYALEREGFGYLRLDGTMSIKARRQVMEQFKNDPEKTVMLVSIKAGGQGLNFTAANHVYVMEPQFNPGVEQQAVDRVHRMGQKRDVFIKHYIMQGPNGERTIEGGILKLQENKEALAHMATDKKRTKAEDARKKLEELRGLFK